MRWSPCALYWAAPLLQTDDSGMQCRLLSPPSSGWIHSTVPSALDEHFEALLEMQSTLADEFGGFDPSVTAPGRPEVSQHHLLSPSGQVPPAQGVLYIFVLDPQRLGLWLRVPFWCGSCANITYNCKSYWSKETKVIDQLPWLFPFKIQA